MPVMSSRTVSANSARSMSGSALIRATPYSCATPAGAGSARTSAERRGHGVLP